MNTKAFLILVLTVASVLAGCSSGPSAADLLPGPWGPPYLLISETIKNDVAERCYGVLYGGVEPAGEVCFHVIVGRSVDEAKSIFSLQGRSWDPYGRPPLGDQAAEFTSTYCKGTAPTMRCEWAHLLTVRSGRYLLWIKSSDTGFARSLSEAKATSSYLSFSDSAIFQAEQILASWRTLAK